MEAVTEVQPGSDTGGTGGTVVVEQPKPWLEQVEKSLRGHESLREINDVNHLTQTFIKEREGRVKLEGDLKGMIKLPGEKATPEEVSAYRKSTGVPDKPEGYEFPQIEGKENSPEMVKWAQGVFHKYHVPKDAATGIGQEWNSFVAGMVEAENKMAEDEKVANEKKFREGFKSEEEYKAGYELAKRHWNKLTGTNFDDAYKEVEAWQQPLFMTYIFNAAKSIGEGISPKGGSQTGGEVVAGIKYIDMDKFKGG